MNSLPILEIYGNGRADNILAGGGGRAHISFTLMVYSDGRCKKTA